MASAALALSIPDAAQAIGVSRATLYRLIVSNDIPVVKVGHRSVIRTVDLEQFLSRNM